MNPLLVFNNACTLWFDKIGPWDWHACCVQHDLDYHNQIGKALADLKLETCVDHILPYMGDIMWFAVTLVGIFWYAAAAKKRDNA